MAKTTNENFHPLSSEELLLKQCEAMLKYALNDGKQVPAHLISDLESVNSKIPKTISYKTNGNQWLSNSTPIVLSSDDVLILANCHNTLVKIVSPARPQTIMLYRTESVGRWQVFFSVPLIRRLLAVAFICLIAIILLGTSSDVQLDGQNISLFNYKGWKLILNAGFLLAAAGLGASFNALFRAREYVTNYTYNPTYEASYWIEFAMGLISGLILSELIYFDISGEEGINMILSRKVTISLIGGFGGLLAYKILNRFVYVLEGIIREKTEDKIDAELKMLEAKSREALSESRIKMSKEITKLQAEVVYKDLKPEEVNKRLEDLANNVVENNYKPVREIPSQDDVFFDRELDGNFTNLDNPEHEGDEYTERI